MSKYDKKYDAFKLFEELQEKGASSPLQSEKIASPVPERRNAHDVSGNDGMYYEIEYDSSPMPGVGRFVLKSQKIKAPLKDEIREIFEQMRDIARENRSLLSNCSKFYDKRVQQENSRIFYKQGMFMKDFEDEYQEAVPYTAYFPHYQMMGYKQLRTYFTWRTQVRRGYVTDISLSYAFLYIYELLCNIGVKDPQEGLDKLLFFWENFRNYNDSVDKYVLRWLKDYHIYYELPQSFREFIEKSKLAMYYPELTASEDNFDLFCTISKYDIRRSVFYTDDKAKLIKDCFYFTIDRLKKVFAEKGINFEDIIFYPTKKMSVWTPFKDALFYPWLRQRDRRVVFSAKEIYICSQNKWTFSTVLTTESGRQLVGYVMKQMESVLRQAVKYKYRLTAGIHTVNTAAVNRLLNEGISLEKVITDAVIEFYRERTKTIVKVDLHTLDKIRQEALLTQEKLIVPEEESPLQSMNAAALQSMEAVLVQDKVTSFTESMESFEGEPWKELKKALSQTEREALLLVLNGAGNIKQFAHKHGIMLEVLSDGINEKAMDCIGDSLLDDEFVIYEDYTEQVKGMVEEI